MAKKTSKPKKKTAAKKKVAAKKTTASKTTAKKAVKKAAPKKKTTAKKKAAKKAPAKNGPSSKTSTSKSSAKASSKKTKQAAKSTGSKSETKSSSKKAAVTRTNGADKKATPIVFSLDDVEALVKSKSSQKAEEPRKEETADTRVTKQSKSVDVDQPVEKRKHGAASLADILGFSPGAKKKDTHLEEDDIPKKWKKYYKLLIELRQHVREELDLHTADTLKHSSRDDSGDLASYGNHQADAGTDTFDRDFALSLVSNEQDALNEIEEAILRIKDGTYGTCEVTGEPISKERLTAVPFARFSVEGQAEYEKNKRRKSDRAAGGLFADSSDAPKLASDDDED